MKTSFYCAIIILVLIGAFPFTYANWINKQMNQSSDIQNVTLYARHDPKDKDFGKAYFSFQFGVRSDTGKEITKNDWDIKYGYVSIYGSSDNFGVTMISNDRSRIKNLGKLKWTDMKEVPILPANPGPYKGIRFPFNGESIEVTSEGQITMAVKGHMYVAHIKDDDTDIYVLFRVEELIPNDRCTISWKVVPSPEEKK